MKNLVFVTFTGCIIFAQSGLFAQKPTDDGPAGIFPTQQEYYDFMVNVKTTAQTDPELRAMIPMINDIALAQPLGSTAKQYGIAASSLGLLSNPQVRADIEMVDEQYKELQAVNSSIEQRLAEQLRRIDFKNSGNAVQQLRAMRQAAQQELNAVLLPHQLSRLRQIGMQSQLRERSLVDLLTSDPLKSELKITQKQIENLQSAEREIEAEISRELARLRQRARNKLLAKLKLTQRAKVEELFGDAFEFGEAARPERKPDRAKGKSK